MPNDIHVSCLSYSQNQCPLDGTRLTRQHIFICFTFQLEGVGGIPKASYVFLKLALDV